MENLIIIGSSNVYLVPQINFDAQNGHCEIAGESYLEETKEFYDKLLDWLRTYMSEVQKGLVLNVKLTYFNTSTSRCLLEVFRLLKGYQLQGNSVKVTWSVDAGEEDYLNEEIEDFITNSGLMIHQVIN